MDLSTHVGALRRFWRSVTACVVVGLALGWLMSATTAEQYQTDLTFFAASGSNTPESDALQADEFAQRRLNSYIGLLGHRWKRVETAEGTVLREAAPEEAADLDVPETDYLLTLDADSMLLRDYCLRLVQFLEQQGNERVAVTQTPYSAYRGAPTRIERIAGLELRCLCDELVGKVAVYRFLDQNPRATQADLTLI